MKKKYNCSIYERFSSKVRNSLFYCAGSCSLTTEGKGEEAVIAAWLFIFFHFNCDAKTMPKIPVMW